jgi:hypothetical protein
MPRKTDGLGKAWAGPSWYSVKPWPDSDEVYLRRLRLIQTPFCTIILHNLGTEDRSEFLHNHPWNFVSIVLWGGYKEVIEDGDETRLAKHRWLSWHKIPASAFHRIVSVKPYTFTMMVTGRRIQPWGFKTDKGWVDWRQYYRENKLLSKEAFIAHLRRKPDWELNPYEVEYLEAHP